MRYLSASRDRSQLGHLLRGELPIERHELVTLVFTHRLATINGTPRGVNSWPAVVNRRGTRGKYAERARRSFETIVVDKKVAAVLGGPEGVTALLEALAKSVGQGRKKRRAA